jgi:hypothetical protein
MSRETNPLTSMCPERLKLSDVVTKAVAQSYAAKDAHDRAVKSKKDAAPFATDLAAARKAESEAVRALDQHRKEHGC